LSLLPLEREISEDAVARIRKAFSAAWTDAARGGHWHPVAHRSELANPGDFVVLPWKAHGGEVAITNIDGELVAFDNRCPHRGARLFTERRGNRPPVCAYHGRCARPEQLRQRYYKAECNGFVFVRDEGPPSALMPEALYQFMQGVPALRLHSTLEFVMDAHWTVCVENALDFEHVAHVHRGSLAKLMLAPLGMDLLDGGSSVERFRSRDGRLGRLGLYFPDQRDFDYAHAHFFPYSALSSTRGWTYSLQHYFPRADGRTDFIHRLYVTETTRPLPDFFAAVARMNAQVFAEDAAVCALVAPGDTGPLGPNEKRIAHFRRHL